ncbi:MAG: thioredoxin domain-containing protein [Bryobacteraceae bacterium]
MHTNRLAREKSPYLLQHAHNPVDWYAWDEEAFAKARSEDKPIFLSIGYSTCHWCHVMEHESFENEGVAAVLNRDFVPIKVDREERPDVDRIYMLFVQATTGSGGWPMSVWLTPDLKPFYGGTYFPPDNRYGRPGFLTLLEHLAKAWNQDRGRVLESAADVVGQLKRHADAGPAAESLDRSVLDSGFFTFRRMFDSKWGGFGNAPKFPRPAVFHFLLRYYDWGKNTEALEMTVHTLREMSRGGMNDQLGGGFHRYSVDERWFVPHFEKMLYDQAQLAISYLEAFQITTQPELAQTARDIFEYVLRDMTSPEGGFYSAEDADSVIDPADPKHKGEGAFYIWTAAEIDAALDPESARIVKAHYGVREGGNVDHDPHGEFGGKNILFEDKPISDEERPLLAAAKIKLFEARKTHVRPGLDDKILTSWNGMMISAFAKGAQILGDSRYAHAALRSATFILQTMFDPETVVLKRRYRDGDAAIDGFLDDYAWFATALADIYETTFETYYLELAVQLAGRMCELFEDAESGGFFATTEGGADLVLRLKEDYDGAEPSGNSVAIALLLRLHAITGREAFLESAGKALAALSSRLTSSPAGVPQLMSAYLTTLSPHRQVVLAGTAPGIAPLLQSVRGHFLPSTVTIAITSQDQREDLGRYQPQLTDMQPMDGKAAAFVCENFACQLPVTEVADLDRLLE